MFRAISLTALLAGALDITAAIIKFYIDTQSGPAPLFKHIASAAFGPEAFTGGKLMMVWGIVFHFMIAFLFTAFLFLAYPKVSRWIRNKFVIGILYGLFTWAVMNLVVVPLSKINKFPAGTKQDIIAALILIFMIGLPVALIAHNYYARKKAI